MCILGKISICNSSLFSKIVIASAKVRKIATVHEKTNCIFENQFVISLTMKTEKPILARAKQLTHDLLGISKIYTENIFNFILLRIIILLEWIVEVFGDSFGGVANVSCYCMHTKMQKQYQPLWIVQVEAKKVFFHIYLRLSSSKKSGTRNIWCFSLCYYLYFLTEKNGVIFEPGAWQRLFWVIIPGFGIKNSLMMTVIEKEALLNRFSALYKDSFL